MNSISNKLPKLGINQEMYNNMRNKKAIVKRKVVANVRPKVYVDRNNTINSVIVSSPLQYVCKTSGKGANKMDTPKIKKFKKSEIDVNKITISHKMSDGTVRNTIADYDIPYNETTIIMYDLIASKVHNHEN